METFILAIGSQIALMDTVSKSTPMGGSLEDNLKTTRNMASDITSGKKAVRMRVGGKMGGNMGMGRTLRGMVLSSTVSGTTERIRNG